MFPNSKTHYRQNRRTGAHAQLVRIISDRWRKRGWVTGMTTRKHTVAERFRRRYGIGRYDDLNGGNDGSQD